MNWNGKLTGGFLGFLFGGPFGLLLGLIAGHLWDAFGAAAVQRSFANPDKTLFFNTTFAVMGHLSKADGQVTEQEIRLAGQVMRELRLDAERRREAQDQFALGKEPNFNLRGALADFEAAYGRVSQLKILFLQIQISAAWADGEVGQAERAMLYEIARHLHIPEAMFRQVEALVAGMASRAHRQQGGAERPPSRSAIASAYRALGASETDSDAVIKRSYRKLISKHHPDKLVSKGLPEALMRAATERTAEIKASYDLIMASRSNGRELCIYFAQMREAGSCCFAQRDQLST